MKYQKLKLTMLGLAGLVSFLPSVSVMAWGPERPTYTMEAPADHAVFNSITNNAAVGDERDFVQIAEVADGATFAMELELQPDKEYAVSIYYHNDASKTYNDAAHNYVGVARDVRLTSYFPDTLKAGERKKIEGIITASNTNPESVWDEAFITASEDLTIKYVEGTARIYNAQGTNKTELSADELFSSHGAFLGIGKLDNGGLNGIIPGCDEYSGQVIYRIKTEATGLPDLTPDPEETVDPELPSELPTAGPMEVALAVVVVIALVAGIVYWQRSSKAVKKATRSARGRKK